MQKSKASRTLRTALKNRTRRVRRRTVLWFYFGNLMWLLAALGGDPRSFRHFLFAAGPVLFAYMAGRNWSQMQRREVAGLDDWAQVERGVNFEELSETGQKEMLRRHRLGIRWLLDADWALDERQQTSRLRANEMAFRILRPALLCFVVAYWMICLWIPAALMDSPVIVSGLVSFIVPLPRAIEMWTEPDETGELKTV